MRFLPKWHSSKSVAETLIAGLRDGSITIDPDELDQNIPEQAVRGLDEAHRRAVASGRKVLVIVDGEMIEIEGEKRIVIKKVPQRTVYPNRIKHAKL
jgi:hypothetical protein